MIDGDLNLEKTLVSLNMEAEYKEQGVVRVEVHDIEEGEISDSASVEEISEEVFNTKQQPTSITPSPASALAQRTSVISSNNKSNANNNNGGGGARVWTVRDLYNYQIASKTSYSRLYNLAWAQAVNNKPLDDVFVMMEDNNSKEQKTDGNNGNIEESKVVIDVEDDGEKEEGELEEGEIDFDSDVVVKNEDFNVAIKEENNKFLERREAVDSIKKELHSLNIADAEKSFDRLCSSLNDLIDRLKKLALEESFAEKDTLVQLLITAIKNVNSVFSSMDLRLKERNRDVLSRLLTHTVTLKPSVFSSPQLKEMEVIMASLNSSTDSMSNYKNNKNKQVDDGFHETDPRVFFQHVNKDSTCPKRSKLELGATGSSDQSKSSFSSEYLKSSLVNLKHKGVALPLLDLHKDHDADSLPSPTREVSLPLPFEKGFVWGHASLKPEWPVPRRTLGRENSVMHPYETAAVQAVSSYQHKFGQSSFSMKDELPSPTPSEETNTRDCEISGEVSSSIIHKNVSSSVNTSSFGQPSTSSINTAILRQSVLSFTPSGNTSSTKPIAVSRSPSVKSRDPRLRLANLNTGLNGPKTEDGGIISSRKQKKVELLVLDGPVIKRQRNEFTGSRIAHDAQATTCSGGSLEDRGTAGTTVPNGNHIEGSVVNASRNLEKSIIVPSLTTGGLENFEIIGQNTTLPVSSPTTTSATSTSHLTSQAISLPASNTNYLQALFRDIAVNPSILMNVLMEHQRSFDSNKIVSEKLNSNSVLGSSNSSMLPKSNSVIGAPASSSMLGHVSAETIQSPSFTISLVESGKVRMKPRDPRRFLHNIAPQIGGTAGPDQTKVNASVSSAVLGNLGTSRPEDQLEKKLAISSTAKPPDITREFTNNLRNIADILPVSQASTSSPVLPQISTSQAVQGNQGELETKGAVTEPGSLRKGNTLALEEGNVGPLRLLKVNAWIDVEHLFEGFDDQQKAAIQKERARRLEEQNKMFADRKLCLVLDLDHTLLNSAKFGEVDPLHDEMLRKKEELDRGKPYRHLFRFPHMGMWTKLRPGIWNFLEKASKLFELHLYTMGNKFYATEMAKLLDPKGELFSGRVLSRGDDGEPFDGDDSQPKTKDLEGVLGMESAVVIIDDSVRVWPHNKLNLIVVERYIYFPCSRRQFGLPGPSLLEIDHDERPEDGTLACSLAVIERIHWNFFANESLDEVDVRNILASEQQKILTGCRIVFSRVFPLDEVNPHKHPLWQTAEQFGAVCTNLINDEVTHVVANSLGTDKVNWALSRGKFVVHPGWVEASALLYRRANEHDFAIKQP